MDRNDLKVARVGFIWMFIGLSFILGAVFGRYGWVNDPAIGVLLLFPSFISLIGAICGFTNILSGGINEI